MASIKPDTTLEEYQNFINEVYGLPNDRFFSTADMLTNMERFAMRGLKGIRKEDVDKTKTNLLISLSWFASMMNQLHINLEKETWKRFPYLCSYCGSCPCSCKEKKLDQRQPVSTNNDRRPKSCDDFQKMFNDIYPSAKRSIEHAAIHLAEEIGEFGESIFAYRGERKEQDFDNIKLEAADLLSCFFGVFNSANLSLAKELELMFSNNCHVCHQAPCSCGFKDIAKFNS